MSKRDITIETTDGSCKAGLFTPDGAAGGGSQPGVILYMDAFGPRPALDEMALRLVGEGYFVLVPDLYYRQGEYEPFDARTAFKDEETGKKLRGMMQATTQAMTASDGAAFIAALTEHGAGGSIGTTGYCMGGARSLHAAASYPERIAAAASFHGGNLASDQPDSPHLRAGEIRARVHVGCAGEDKSFPPEQSALFAKAFREAGVDFVLENYLGKSHGWAVPDHSVHDPDGAERHWRRLIAFFGETLQ